MPPSNSPATPAITTREQLYALVAQDCISPDIHAAYLVALTRAKDTLKNDEAAAAAYVEALPQRPIQGSPGSYYYYIWNDETGASEGTRPCTETEALRVYAEYKRREPAAFRAYERRMKEAQKRYLTTVQTDPAICAHTQAVALRHQRCEEMCAAYNQNNP